jgi:hypothetical protein
VANLIEIMHQRTLRRPAVGCPLIALSTAAQVSGAALSFGPRYTVSDGYSKLSDAIQEFVRRGLNQQPSASPTVRSV